MKPSWLQISANPSEKEQRSKIFQAENPQQASNTSLRNYQLPLISQAMQPLENFDNFLLVISNDFLKGLNFPKWENGAPHVGKSRNMMPNVKPRNIFGLWYPFQDPLQINKFWSSMCSGLKYICSVVASRDFTQFFWISERPAKVPERHFGFSHAFRGPSEA